MNFKWKFAVFALSLMTWFQERVKLLVGPFLELLNILILEHIYRTFNKGRHYVPKQVYSTTPKKEQVAIGHIEI